MVSREKYPKIPKRNISRDEGSEPNFVPIDQPDTKLPNSQSTTISTIPPSGVDTEALADMQAYTSLREKRKKARRKKVIVTLTVCVVLVVVLVGGGMWFLNSLAPEPMEGGGMSTAFVEKGTFIDSVSASGKLKPISSVSATPEVDGLVGEVFVSEGDTVTAGQELYTIINDDLDKTVSQAQQAINEAYAGIELAQIALDDAYRAKSTGIAAAAEAEKAAAAAAAKAAEAAKAGESSAGLVMENSGSAETPVAFDVAQADSAIRQAELNLASANAALAEAQTTYDNAVATAGKRRVTSPIDGSVVSVAIEPGAALGGASGSTTTPVQIANLSQMQISIEVNEIDILKIAVDQVAELSFSALPDVVLQGKVTHIATINTGAQGGSDMDAYGTVTYTVSILIEEPDPRLKPGMSGKASIEVKRLDDVLMVPLSAVTVLSDTEGLVYLFDPENPEVHKEQAVEILASDGLSVALKGGISEGDEIVMIGGGDLMGAMGGEGDLSYATSSGSVTVG